MAMDFPSNPTDGQVYQSYIYSASSGVWKAREESASPAVISSVPPPNPSPGDIWVDSSDGVSYFYYLDGTSSQWVELMSSGVPQIASKANLDGGNSFTGTQTFGTPIGISSGGTGSATGINLVPTGCIMMWYTSTPPSGWLLCNGQSTSGYPALAAIVGANVPNLENRVPVGKGTGTFASLGSTGGAETHQLTALQIPGHTHSGTTGNNNVGHTHTFSGTTSWVGDHSHTQVSGQGGGGLIANTAQGGISNASGQTTSSVTRGAGAHDHTYSGTTSGVSANHTHTFITDNGTGGGQAHNNLQPYIVLNYIIKA